MRAPVLRGFAGTGPVLVLAVVWLLALVMGTVTTASSRGFLPGKGAGLPFGRIALRRKKRDGKGFYFITFRFCCRSNENRERIESENLINTWFFEYCDLQ
ncbi:hypothetical protein CEXT_239391 [Caerostris extrusa]|uniref:Secreted protein n=1 Tax=Caerostris extrusa TaxID=172846 RepID=A0AAV4XEL3_CAEEX|nr:hypothetical protein CEXT_239391 [Caerostris extrusa]